MKKAILPVIVLVICSIALKAQIAYYDSKSLADPLNNKGINSDKKVVIKNNSLQLKILAHYAGSQDEAVIVQQFENNPFILIDKSNNFTPQSGNKVGLSASKTAGAIGGLDVTKYANAIASLMIDRAKEELTVAFFERMKTFSQKNPEFKVLFPKTFEKLENLLSYTYPKMLPTLRQAFFEDIQQMNYSLEAVLLLPKYSGLVADHPELSIAIKMLNLMQQLERGEIAAVDVLSGIEKKISNSSIDGNSAGGLQNLKATVQFANLFSNSLRSTTKDQSWVSFKEAFQDNVPNLSDAIVLQIYLGLVWQKAKTENIMFVYEDKKPIPVTDILKVNAKNIFFVQNQLKQFLTVGDKVQLAYKEIQEKKAKSEKNSAEDIYNYICTSVDAVDFTLGLIKVFNDNFNYVEYISLVRGANDLYKAIYSQEYTIAMNSAFNLLGDIQQLKKGTDGKKDDVDKLAKFSKKVEPYAMFMANVADAEKEEDIKSALDNAILPVGSSSIKKNSSFNVSIQSYLGAYYSLKNEKSNVIRAWSDEAGVYGPIGISVTPGFLSWGKGGSLSLFLSAFDLGAIIDYQLKQDSTVVINSENPTQKGYTKDYKVSLGQITSPGVHFVYGCFGNIPLSLGIGAQYGPGLSKIDNPGNATVTNPSWRFNMFLAVDMPFFNIVNRRR